MTNLKSLDMDYFKRIAERVKKEKETPKVEPTQTSQASTKIGDPKSGYVYVPKLALYISENKFFQGNTWSEIQEFLHKEGRRMPTIPEFIEFVNYLRTLDGRSEVKNAKDILGDIYPSQGEERGEWLDASFFQFRDSEDTIMGVTYHIFENGKIKTTWEKLENYHYNKNISRIDLENWLVNPTKQGLPKTNINMGAARYLSPQGNHKVAGIYTDSNFFLNCNNDRAQSFRQVGVRYVELNPGAKN